MSIIGHWISGDWQLIISALRDSDGCYVCVAVIWILDMLKMANDSANGNNIIIPLFCQFYCRLIMTVLYWNTLLSIQYTLSAIRKTDTESKSTFLTFFTPLPLFFNPLPFPFNSSSLSCVSAWNWPEPSEGEADKQEDGQQVGKCVGVHRRDTECGAGVLHSWRPLQSPACTSVWLPGWGMITYL